MDSVVTLSRPIILIANVDHFAHLDTYVEAVDMPITSLFL